MISLSISSLHAQHATVYLALVLIPQLCDVTEHHCQVHGLCHCMQIFFRLKDNESEALYQYMKFRRTSTIYSNHTPRSRNTQLQNDLRQPGQKAAPPLFLLYHGTSWDNITLTLGSCARALICAIVSTATSLSLCMQPKWGRQ